jgi:putative oxidoreductase
MVIHGVIRVANGTVDDFGGFLSGLGLPLGLVVAWTLTVVEIVGGLVLVSGRLVPWLCAWFAIQLLVGIATVHWSQGWFVVGAGRGGMEYSVLLIVCLCVIRLTNDSPQD